MPQKATKETADTQVGANPQLENVAELNSAAIEILTHACQAYTLGMASLNSELASFMNARVNRDVQLGHDLVQCNNWSEAVELQQDWARQATQEYLDEAGRLVDLASKVAKDKLGASLREGEPGRSPRLPNPTSDVPSDHDGGSSRPDTAIKAPVP